ncbi:glycosyltransferase family 4 protein [Blautia sp. MSJ-19]|uniref:glycosyltransferase family 4 protein n=1 Tax=Blautia sp. MSJ-19 TaxID=2841517 RepID=UPI001C0E9A0E|nr:glycosyltransferase family 4 protein [Blautia sp. MSJ-19]MBU5480138.1 glycosyltransferase family 4 protein [Blautia sp. MSJ-19]
MRKILLVTFSDNADHQDTLFGMYEEIKMQSGWDPYLLCIKTPKVELKQSDHTWLVDCPERPGVTKKTFNLLLLVSIIHRIHREHFEAIYFESLHTWNLPIMMMAGKAKTYQVIHEVIPHEGDSQVKMVDLMNKAVVKFADTIVLRNKTYIQDMIDRYGISANRVKYLELWRRYPAYTAPVHSGRVLFFGRINPYKGADNLLEIVRLCPDIQFDVIGRVDPQMQGIVEQLAKEKNVKLNNDYVTDEEMRDAFINCDWTIVPYNSASQSGIIIDAYKYSRPVIAFAVGAIPEQVDAGKSGYLVEAGDNKKFAEKLKEVVKLNREKYDAMSRYAYQYGCKKYATSGAVERFVSLLEE